MTCLHCRHFLFVLPVGLGLEWVCSYKTWATLQNKALVTGLFTRYTTSRCTSPKRSVHTSHMVLSQWVSSKREKYSQHIRLLWSEWHWNILYWRLFTADTHMHLQISITNEIQNNGHTHPEAFVWEGCDSWQSALRTCVMIRGDEYYTAGVWYNMHGSKINTTNTEW